jgi:hypothetical protein
VIGLNDKGEIELPNRSASELLGRNVMQHIGERWATWCPRWASWSRRRRAGPPARPRDRSS